MSGRDGRCFQQVAARVSRSQKRQNTKSVGLKDHVSVDITVNSFAMLSVPFSTFCSISNLTMAHF